MAAPMKVAGRNGINYCRLLFSRKGLIPTCHQKNAMSSSSPVANVINQKKNKVEHPEVGMSEDGRTLVCWHSEPQHPYHLTKPMEVETKSLERGEGVLRDEVLHLYDTRHRPEGPTVQELSSITYTTKHRWFPKPEKRYRKKNPPKDRDHI